MIKVRLSIMAEAKGRAFQIAPNETLYSATERSLCDIFPSEQTWREHFITVVNGHVIDPSLRRTHILNQTDEVLIAPKMGEGEGGAIFRTAAIILVTVYTSGLMGTATATGWAAVGAASVTAAASIATAALLNSMFPPPVMPTEGLGDVGLGSLASSQMYTVSGQSNQARKYSTVPKVYGTHRIFPALAANPYVELQSDNGTLVQYLYAIYDLGFGPMQVTDIQIGDTPIEQFSDVDYRLVDFNKPAVSEGIWDDSLEDGLTFYKGDIEKDPISIAFTKDQDDAGAPEDSYRAIRDCAENPTDISQEISLTFVCPSGLYSLNAVGDKGENTIVLDIEFARVGTDSWFGYNDFNVSKETSIVGGEGIDPETIEVPLPYSQGFPAWPRTGTQTRFAYTVFDKATQVNRIYYYINSPIGIPKGATTIVLATNNDVIGKDLRIEGQYNLGRVISATPHAQPGYTTYTFQAPVTRNITLAYHRAPDVTSGPVGPALDPLPPGTKTPFFPRILSGNTNVRRAYITSDSTSPVYASFKFTPKTPGEYKVRVTRVGTFPLYTSQTRSELTWIDLSTRFDRSPIVTDKRHVFLELKIRATNQLSGTIQNLSAVCSSVIPVWNGSAWVKQFSDNPAWIFADLLTGEVNKRAISRDRLHIDSLVEWADFCDEVPTPPTGMIFALPRFTTNLVIDFNPTLQTILGQITSAAQASLNIIDGKYGVLIDKLKTVPIQVFTPRNYSNFTSSRSYTRRPDAVKVSFIDPTVGWDIREAIVYDNGFNAGNAVDIDEVSSFACTNDEQAWRFGRYLLAQNRLRQENIRITVDFENLVCTRGDFVQFTQDVMKVGGSPARVKAVTGNQIQIDDAIETGAFDYGFVFRGIDGTIYEGTLTVDTADTFTLDGSDIPEVGDLIIIGEVDSIVLDCLVKSIEPNDDMSATLILIEKADAIYDAESSDEVPNYNPAISATSDTEFSPPSEVENLQVTDNFYECTGAALDYKVTIDWDVPVGAAYDIFEIWVDAGNGYNLVDTTKKSIYTYTADRDDLGEEHSFKVLAVSATGKKLDIGSVTAVTATVSAKTTPPDSVASVDIDITGEILQLLWPKVADCSCEEYLIRYSPDLSFATWERSIPLLRVDRNTTLAATQARTGVYFIKARDFEGNESALAATAITTVPELFNLNFIEETTDFPTLLGAKDRTEVSAGNLYLKQSVIGDSDTTEYYSEGFYYYYNLLNLGEIYTVRLQSLIQAEGFTLGDLMINWDPLSEVDPLSAAGSSEWDVETQYRTTNSFNVMADWADLASVDQLSAGSSDDWSIWRKFTIGDATGRIIQFRLRLISNKVSVTPRVFDGTIKADMPDRLESIQDIAAPDTGIMVEFDPAFAGPSGGPSIQISIDTAQSGDYWTITSKTVEGFYIQFFDKFDSAVARTFDVYAKGYGRQATEVI